MADEIKKVITIEVGQATASLQDVKDKTDEASQSFNSLKDYKKHIDKLTASLVDLEEGSEKYNDTVRQVQAAQNKLNQIVSDAKTSSKAAEGSYNALQQQMNALKKQWKETSDEAERADLGKQIVKINDKLKDMDGSIGNYQRNVGNYASAFASISPAAGTAVNAVKGLSGAFKALIANPDLSISIVDKAFAFAQVYDSEFITPEHFIESFEYCDRIYETSRNQAIARLRHLNPDISKPTPRILKIDFNKNKK